MLKNFTSFAVLPSFSGFPLLCYLAWLGLALSPFSFIFSINFGISICPFATPNLCGDVFYPICFHIHNSLTSDSKKTSAVFLFNCNFGCFLLFLSVASLSLPFQCVVFAFDSSRRFWKKKKKLKARCHINGKWKPKLSYNRVLELKTSQRQKRSKRFSNVDIAHQNIQLWHFEFPRSAWLGLMACIMPFAYHICATDMHESQTDWNGI